MSARLMWPSHFVRVKPAVLDQFARERGLTGLPEREVEDEFVYQNTFHLNSKYYASLGEKQAFVLSQGRNMLILKIVGYAEQIVTYYKLEDFKGHVWIAHQRYPTRGRVWHPGGAHPFCGLNEALVHNGDFANYYSVTEYLAQRNVRPLFLTDTEVSILVFDLWNRVYRTRWSISSRVWRRPPSATSTCCRIQAGDLSANSGEPRPCLAGRPVVLHYRAQRPRQRRISASGHHRYGYASPAGFCLAGWRSPDRPGLLREAGDRCDSSQPCQGGPAILPHSRRLLERARRQLYGWRRVRVHRQARSRRRLSAEPAPISSARERCVKSGKRPDLDGPVNATGGLNVGAILAGEAGEALFDAGTSEAAWADLAGLRYLCPRLQTGT